MTSQRDVRNETTVSDVRYSGCTTS